MKRKRKNQGEEKKIKKEKGKSVPAASRIDFRPLP